MKTLSNHTKHRMTQAQTLNSIVAAIFLQNEGSTHQVQHMAVFVFHQLEAGLATLTPGPIGNTTRALQAKTKTNV
jgi:hypothetical protein